MTRTKAKLEPAVAGPVQDWLQSRGWDVFPEVELIRGEAIVDLVAVQGELACAFEAKMSLSLRLLRQAEHWQAYADSVSVAVPAPTKDHTWEDRRKMYPIFERLGIGLVHVFLREESRVEVAVKARFAGGEDHSRKLRSILRPEHRMATPGESGGRRYTVCQLTLMRLAEYVRANPGCMLRQAVGGIEHHWKSSTQAISQISTLLKKGAIRGVRGETENGLTVLYPGGEEREDVIVTDTLTNDELAQICRDAEAWRLFLRLFRRDRLDLEPPTRRYPMWLIVDRATGAIIARDRDLVQAMQKVCDQDQEAG